MEQQSVSQLFQRYLERSKLAPSSVHIKRQALVWFVQCCGDPPAGAVTVDMAEAYQVHVAASTSDSTANTYVANLKPFWRWLRESGRIAADPFTTLRLYPLPEPEPQIFTSAELERLVKVTADDPYWRARIGFGLVGCRRGEMFEIEANNVHLDDRTPHALLSSKKARANGWAWRTKTHRLRYIPIPAVLRCGRVCLEFRQAVERCIELTPSGQPYILIEPKYYARMMQRVHTGTLRVDHVNDPFGNFQRLFNTVQRRAAICPAKRFHDLRRGFGTAAVERLGLAGATDALGNASVDVTRRHYHVRDRLQQVARLNRDLEHFYESNVS